MYYRTSDTIEIFCLPWKTPLHFFQACRTVAVFFNFLLSHGCGLISEVSFSFQMLQKSLITTTNIIVNNNNNNSNFNKKVSLRHSIKKKSSLMIEEKIQERDFWLWWMRPETAAVNILPDSKASGDIYRCMNAWRTFVGFY